MRWLKAVRRAEAGWVRRWLGLAGEPRPRLAAVRGRLGLPVRTGAGQCRGYGNELIQRAVVTKVGIASWTRPPFRRQAEERGCTG